MGFASDAVEVAKRFLKIGQIGEKGGEDAYAVVWNSAIPPQANCVYRCINAHQGHFGYGYRCPCGGWTIVIGDRFALYLKRQCSNCGGPFCIRDLLMRDMEALRAAKAKAAGKSVKTGPFTIADEQDAEERWPFYRVGAPAPVGPRFVDTWDTKRGAADGEVKYGGSNPGTENLSDSAFNDPFASRFRR